MLTQSMRVYLLKLHIIYPLLFCCYFTFGSSQDENDMYKGMEWTFSNVYKEEGWVMDHPRGKDRNESLWKDGHGALSGPGSDKIQTQFWREYLVKFIKEHNIESVIDAGCGHWPSGYQRFVHWPPIDYLGIDIVSTVTEQNLVLAKSKKYGLRSLDFEQGDMSKRLPTADLIIVKEVFLHVPNKVITNFLERNFDPVAPRFKYLLAVGSLPSDDADMTPDERPGGLRPIRLWAKPFSLPKERVKVVHLGKDGEQESVEGVSVKGQTGQVPASSGVDTVQVYTAFSSRKDL